MHIFKYTLNNRFESGCGYSTNGKFVGIDSFDVNLRFVNDKCQQLDAASQHQAASRKSAMGRKRQIV